MKKGTMIAGLFCAHLLAEGCATHREELLPLAYVQWVESEENGLRTSKTLNGYTLDLQYKPAEYVVLAESGAENFSATSVATDVSAISDMQYFTLRISKENGGDLLSNDVTGSEEFSSRLVYFSSAIQNDLFLVDGGDTLPCALFHFERTYSVDPRSTFLIGFLNSAKRNNGAKSKTFVFEDHELGIGPVVLSIDHTDLERIPFLKLD